MVAGMVLMVMLLVAFVAGRVFVISHFFRFGHCGGTVMMRFLLCSITMLMLLHFFHPPLLLFSFAPFKNILSIRNDGQGTGRENPGCTFRETEGPGVGEYQIHVRPAVILNSPFSLGQHGIGCIDPDDLPRSSDCLTKQPEVESGTTADLHNGVSGL